MISTPRETDTVLPRSLILEDEPPADKRACLEFVLEKIAETGRITDREKALEAILEREAVRSTAIGDGVAIPHAETEAVTTPTVAIATASNGVAFGSLDDELVTIIAMILVPPNGNERYLSLLSSIAKAFLDAEVRATIERGDDPAVVRRELLARIDEDEPSER